MYANIRERNGHTRRAQLGGAASAALPGFSASEEKALRTTTLFEVGRPLNFDGLTGNFDGQGLSFGLLQWNFGTGSLQPLLTRFMQRAPARFNAVFGPDAGRMRQVLAASLAAQRQFARSINDAQNRILQPWAGYFHQLAREPAFRQIQLGHTRRRMNIAIRYANQLGLRTERGLALMFDNVTQNGPAWLRRKNRAELIRQRRAAFQRRYGRPPGEREFLAIIAHVIADTVLPRWRERVRRRRLAIVRGSPRLTRNGINLTDQPFSAGTSSSSRSASQPALNPQGSLQIDLARAVRLNRQYARRLGWSAHTQRIAALLGLRGQPSTPVAFALAAARWQQVNGLRPVDGIIGPKTWSRLRTRLSRGGAARGSQPTQTGSQTSDSDRDAFMERVLQAHLASKRRPPTPDLRDDQLETVEGTQIKMRRDAALAASRMIAAANRDLAAAQEAGDPDARRTTSISATSGYRDRADQLRLWRQYFRANYYPNTARQRARLPGGPHGEQAVQVILDYLRWRIAAPGYSRHQAGLAIDLKQHRTRGNPVYNRTDSDSIRRWRNTWFFRWLQTNAQRFNFAPYEREPWHWTYQPGG